MIRVNLLGVAKAKRRRVRAPIIEPGGGLVLGLLVGVIVVVAAVPCGRYGQVQAQYETFSRRKELLQARINIIEQLKAQQSGPLILLNTLASSVSATESLWLTGFQKTGARVSVTGTALSMRAVAAFMTRLKSSNTFR